MAAYSGHIIGGPVDPDYDGATLTADVTVGDTVIFVDETGDFDEDALERDAQLVIGADVDDDGELIDGTPVAYLTCDDDAGTVTLAAAATAAASSGDQVYLIDPVSGSLVGRLEVLVAIDDADTSGDALTAYLDVSLLESVGDVDLTDLAVDLDEDEDDQLYVTGFPGLNRRQGGVKFMQDQLTVTATGDQALTLTYVPIKNSEHLYWNGNYQPGSEWTRDGWDVTISDSADLIKVDDTLVMEYAYRDPGGKPSTPASLILIGSAHATTSGDIALPDGTESGDLLVLSIIARAIDFPATTTDARITASYTDTINPGAPTFNGFMGYGYEDGSGDPITVTLPTGWAELAVFRITGAVSDVHTPVDVNTTPTTMPDPEADMGIAVLIGVCAVGSDGGFVSDSTGAWTTVSPGTDSNGTPNSGKALMAYCTAGTPDGSWAGLNSSGKRASLVIGLTETS